ncbi:hypothetical protein [Sphingomonas oryzagri]
MADFATAPSRRALLQTLAIVPAAASTLPIVSPWAETLTTLHNRYDDHPAVLARTREGRNLSRFRYQNAERSCQLMELGFFSEPRHAPPVLHQAGFVTQQALCAYLLDIGFTDAWNARHIKQDIAKALAYANATGLGYDCRDVTRLATVLSPYWKWGYHYDDWEEDRPRTGGFLPATITPLARALVEHVRDVTGHPRPNGARALRREVRS